MAHRRRNAGEDRGELRLRQLMRSIGQGDVSLLMLASRIYERFGGELTLPDDLAGKIRKHLKTIDVVTVSHEGDETWPSLEKLFEESTGLQNPAANQAIGFIRGISDALGIHVDEVIKLSGYKQLPRFVRPGPGQIGPSDALARLLRAEIRNEDHGGVSPATLESALDSVHQGYDPGHGGDMSALEIELESLIEQLGPEISCEDALEAILETDRLAAARSEWDRIWMQAPWGEVNLDDLSPWNRDGDVWTVDAQIDDGYGWSASVSVEVTFEPETANVRSARPSELD